MILTVYYRSGAVFGLGKNTFGQLGVGDFIDRTFPTQLKTLRNSGVRYIAAGQDFSVFLTHQGGVLTCGAGTHGQLGNGNKNNAVLPQMVFDMMGTPCIQVACGDNHALVLSATCERIYAFGSGSLGANRQSFDVRFNFFTTKSIPAMGKVFMNNHVFFK